MALVSLISMDGRLDSTRPELEGCGVLIHLTSQGSDWIDDGDIEKELVLRETKNKLSLPSVVG